MSPIALYQRYVSREFNGARGRCCHYTPTCSQYARDAIEAHGLREGGEMAFMRFMRCMPDVQTTGKDEVPGAHHEHCGVRAPEFVARPDVSRGARLAAGAARVLGKVLGGLGAGLAGAVGGACLGGYLGAKAGQGQQAMDDFHGRVAGQHSPDSLKGLQRIERATCGLGRLTHSVVLGAIGGAITGALGGFLAVGKLGWEMGGTLGKNATLDLLGQGREST